jgi:hypothetical protein
VLSDLEHREKERMWGCACGRTMSTKDSKDKVINALSSSWGNHRGSIYRGDAEDLRCEASRLASPIARPWSTKEMDLH